MPAFSARRRVFDGPCSVATSLKEKKLQAKSGRSSCLVCWLLRCCLLFFSLRPPGVSCQEEAEEARVEKFWGEREGTAALQPQRYMVACADAGTTQGTACKRTFRASNSKEAKNRRLLSWCLHCVPLTSS